MATIERRNNRFRLIFYHLGRRYAASLKTVNEREADAIAGSCSSRLGSSVALLLFARIAVRRRP